MLSNIPVLYSYLTFCPFDRFFRPAIKDSHKSSLLNDIELVKSGLRLPHIYSQAFNYYIYVIREIKLPHKGANKRLR